MPPTAQTAAEWTKPELIRCGRIADVAGSNDVNANGASVNPRDPLS